MEAIQMECSGLRKAFGNGFHISEWVLHFEMGIIPLKKLASEDFPRGVTAHPKSTF
jgi:hypothetical protein